MAILDEGLKNPVSAEVIMSPPKLGLCSIISFQWRLGEVISSGATATSRSVKLDFLVVFLRVLGFLLLPTASTPTLWNREQKQTLISCLIFLSQQ